MLLEILGAADGTMATGCWRRRPAIPSKAYLNVPTRTTAGFLTIGRRFRRNLPTFGSAAFLSQQTGSLARRLALFWPANSPGSSAAQTS